MTSTSPSRAATQTDWAALTGDELGVLVRGLLPGSGPHLVLVDGRSGSGKSTFADRLAAVLSADVVRTDDLAWHHDPLDWDGLLTDEILRPWLRSEPVSYQPPAWVRRRRPGSIEAAASRSLLVEGVGAAREGLSALAHLVVWVHSQRHEARRRGIARDVEAGRTPIDAEAFWEAWMEAEAPFLAADRPWTRARLVVDGTPPPDTPTGLTVVATQRIRPTPVAPVRRAAEGDR